MDQRRWRAYWRAWHVRSIERRTRPVDEQLAGVSPWAFWGLHR